MSRALLLGYLAIIIGFVGLKLAEEWQPVQYCWDSDGYVYAASWWGGLRPFTVPVFFKLCGGNNQVIHWAQIVLSLAAWLWLAHEARGLNTTGAGKIAALTLVLLVGASRAVSLWDGFILSDSLSYSLFAAIVAAWIYGERNGWPVQSLALLCLLLGPWCFARDFNAVICCIIGATILGLVALRKAPPRLGLVAVITFIVVVVNQLDVKQGRRWHESFFNVLGRKVLVQPEMKQYFVEHGMPLSPRIEAMRGRVAPEFEKIPELENWAANKGRSTLLFWLMTHPRAGVADVRTSTLPVSAYVPQGYWTPYDLPRFTPLFMLGLAGLTAARRRHALAAALLLSAPFVYYLAVGADAMESTRHALQAPIQLAVATAILIAGAIDRLALRFHPRPAPNRSTNAAPELHLTAVGRGAR